MGLGIKRGGFWLLDRPGLRGVLAFCVNATAAMRGRSDFRTFYESGRWFHTATGMTFPGGPRFDYDPARMAELLGVERKFVDDAEDYWLKFISLTAGAVVVDVGAGQGEDVLAFSRATGRDGKVIAIEAFPATYVALDEFCRRNDLKNVVPLNIALGQDERKISFNESLNWVENAVVDATGDSFSVRSTTLSTVCKEQHMSAIDYLKMNIEGAEIDALQGMADVIERVGAICVSCHDFRAERGDGARFRTKEFVVGFLRHHGFDLHFRDDARPYVRDQVFGVNRAAQLGRAPRFNLKVT